MVGVGEGGGLEDVSGKPAGTLSEGSGEGTAEALASALGESEAGWQAVTSSAPRSTTAGSRWLARSRCVLFLMTLTAHPDY
jgi:hypothetical protein